MNPFKSYFPQATASLIGGALLLGVIAPQASAFSFVPQQEGKVNAGFDTSLAGSYINTSGFSVESLDFDVSRNNQTFTGKSRLFVDQAGTANQYGGGINFKAFDIGTSESAYSDFWFRPVAMLTNSSGNVIEQGQLEAGRFLFTFDAPLAFLDLDFFDVESAGTSILSLNGQAYSAPVAKAGNNSIQSIQLENVSSFEVMIGNANTSGPNKNEPGWATGDGVLLKGQGEVQAVDVPEPMTTTGLIMVGAGLFWARRQRKSSVA